MKELKTNEQIIAKKRHELEFGNTVMIALLRVTEFYFQLCLALFQCGYIETRPNPCRAACPCSDEYYKINKDLTNFNEQLTKPCHGLINFTIN